MREHSYNMNSTNLYSFTNENLHSFCLSLYIKAGCIFENDDNNGITHLLEHIIFRNIKRKYSGKLYELLIENGLNFTACTYKEFMYFTLSGPSYGFEFATDVVCNIFDELKISGADFKLEKNRIKAEIREKNERNSVYNYFSRNIWTGTTNDRLITGYCRNIDRISIKKLEEYRKETFVAENCFFYVTGNISQPQIEQFVSKIERLKIKSCCIIRKNEVSPSEKFFNRDTTWYIKEGSYYSLSFGFDTDNKKYPGAVYDLIYRILFSSDNAVLFKAISEDSGLAYSYDSVYEQYDNIGNINFCFDIAENKIEESLCSVVSAINDLKSGNFNFEANLSYEISSWVTMLDNPCDLNWSLAYYNHILNTDPVDFEQEKLGRFNTVTKAQIVAAANDIFRRKNLTIVIEGKKSKIIKHNLNSILDSLD